MSFRKLNSEHLNDLEFLTTLDVDYVSEFCRIAIDFIVNGGAASASSRSAQKLFVAASKKLGCSKDDIQKTVTSLSYLFTECAKLDMDVLRLKYALTVDSDKWKELDADHVRLQVIGDCYEQNQANLRNLFLKIDSTESCFGIRTIPQYKDFEWRLDMECDRRSMMNNGGGGSNAELKPTFMVHLVTNQKDKDYNFQMSFDDLKHVTDVMGEALKELKSAHVRRIRHYIH